MDKHQYLVQTSRSHLRSCRMELWRNSLPQGDLQKMRYLRSSMTFDLLLGIALKQVLPPFYPNNLHYCRDLSECYSSVHSLLPRIYLLTKLFIKPFMIWLHE